jgi:hypothetical protein
MITPGPGMRIWVAADVTDMRRGFDGLAALVQQQLGHDPFSGALFIFHGRRGHLLKILVWDGWLFRRKPADDSGERHVRPETANASASRSASPQTCLRP